MQYPIFSTLVVCMYGTGSSLPPSCGLASLHLHREPDPTTSVGATCCFCVVQVHTSAQKRGHAPQPPPHYETRPRLELTRCSGRLDLMKRCWHGAGGGETCRRTDRTSTHSIMIQYLLRGFLRRSGRECELGSKPNKISAPPPSSKPFLLNRKIIIIDTLKLSLIAQIALIIININHGP